RDTSPPTRTELRGRNGPPVPLGNGGQQAAEVSAVSAEQRRWKHALFQLQEGARFARQHLNVLQDLGQGLVQQTGGSTRWRFFPSVKRLEQTMRALFEQDRSERLGEQLGTGSNQM